MLLLCYRLARFSGRWDRVVLLRDDKSNTVLSRTQASKQASKQESKQPSNLFWVHGDILRDPRYQDQCWLLRGPRRVAKEQALRFLLSFYST
ncbi:hypothetical protein M0802_007410 [Mischocyttarus mexicanus]|nr:hypothetical protein M0802_007410 [Mischocyttarus mexicanus]